MMRPIITIAIASVAFSCDRTPPPSTDKPATTVVDMSCGAIMGSVNGNAELVLFDDMVRQKQQKKDPFKVYPQIVVEKTAIWGAGADLRIRFLDGDEPTRKFVGRGALAVAHGSPTMGLAGLLQSNDLALRRAYVLHEFGHALGAVHEHQRPDAPLTWRLSVVNAHYLNLYGWSEAQTYAQVIRPLHAPSLVASPDFDRMSVMMYPIHKEFTEQQFVQPWNSQLTAWDRKVMASLYR